MADLYTKIVLTVIACALSALVAQNQFGVQNALAERQLGASPQTPVYVATTARELNDISDYNILKVRTGY